MTDYVDYTLKCSEKTLQSRVDGFFLSFADNLAEIAGKRWIEKNFGKQRTDRERIQSLYQYESIKEPLVQTLSNIREFYRKKSSQIACLRIQEADQCLAENKPFKSLTLFSQAVLRAEKSGENLTFDNGKTLSLALYGRAKILMELEKFDFAQTDIQLALKENLPDCHKSEAYLKLAICHKIIGEDKKAGVAFAIAQKLSNSDDKTMIDRYRNSVSYATFEKPTNRELPKISGNCNANFPSASDKLDVKTTKILGRHVVSKECIKTGDTLVVESPQSACLILECFGTHCQNCFERLIAPVPCPTCANVAFCTLKCRDEALETYHKFECKIFELLLGAGISVLCHLALRMVTQYTLEKNLEIFDRMKDSHIFSLCTNSDKRNPKDFFRRTVMVALLLRCLQITGYFKSPEDSNIVPTEEGFKIGEILLFNLQMLQFNTHEIYEKIHSSKHRFKGSKIKNIGVGIYPTVALFNHQCYPSVTRFFVGKNIVIKAIKPLLNGDLVGENYGPIFTKKPLSVRQNYLWSRYWFKCGCPACFQNWPVFEHDTPEGSTLLKCPSVDCDRIFTLPLLSEIVGIACSKCKKPIDLRENIEILKKCEDQYYLALAKMDDMQTMEGICVLTNALDTFDRISTAPHKKTHIAEETLKALYADCGNCHEIQDSK